MTASITSSIILFANPQKNGTINVRERHTDSLGNDYYFDYVATVQTDQQAHLMASAEAIPAQQAQVELQNALAFTIAGNDPRTYAFNWNDPATAYAQLMIMMVSIPSVQALPFAPVAITYDVNTLQADIPNLTAQQADDIVAWATSLNSAYTAIQQAETQRLALAATL